jgi:hypothetical protein
MFFGPIGCAGMARTNMFLLTYLPTDRLTDLTYAIPTYGIPGMSYVICHTGQREEEDRHEPRHAAGET